MSDAVLNDLKQFDNTKPKIVLPHPVYDIFGEKTDRDTAIKKLDLSENYRYILFFGFIRKYKGLDILLEAFAKFDHKKYNVKLIVAGEFYEDQKPYLDIISKNNCSESVILKGDYIPTDDVKYYFAAADMVAQTYRSATQSGVAQVAYHFERPLLVTNVGGLAEIVPHMKTGYIAETDPDSVAGFLEDFYANDRENDFAANIITEKKRFAWEYFVQGLEGIYSQL